MRNFGKSFIKIVKKLIYIQSEIEKISTATLEAVIQNFIVRIRHVITTDGSRIENIIT